VLKATGCEAAESEAGVVFMSALSVALFVTPAGAGVSVGGTEGAAEKVAARFALANAVSSKPAERATIRFQKFGRSDEEMGVGGKGGNAIGLEAARWCGLLTWGDRRN
jgi:hypothetical protein